MTNHTCFWPDAILAHFQTPFQKFTYFNVKKAKNLELDKEIEEEEKAKKIKNNSAKKDLKERKISEKEIDISEKEITFS